jgi:hypothetical protein
MRQIDNMTPDEINILELKGMLPSPTRKPPQPVEDDEIVESRRVAASEASSYPENP